MASMQFTDSTEFMFGQTGNAVDLLLIKLGGRSFGLLLSNVRHICPMPSGFVGYGVGVDEHFVFQDEPLPYVSLWNVFGLTSEYAEYEEMQAMLPQRRQDHLDWMDALEDAIRNGTRFSKARNPRECAFGKWYYDFRTRDLRLSLLMRHFEQPHAEIHRLADRLLTLSETGQVRDALQDFEQSKNTTLAELLELFDSTQELVAELQRRIAIIVADGNGACALGADGVKDIVTLPAERIKPTMGMGTAATATSALIILDDQTVVPLIDWRTFFADRGMRSMSV